MSHINGTDSRDSRTRTRVAFLGPEGTYSHQAAFNRFGDSVEYIQKDSIADTFNAVPSEASIALIPAENSIFGPVVETLDLLRLPEVGNEKLIRGDVALQVQHCLLAVRGTGVDDIKYVLSHEQALGQCSSFLKTRLPNAVLTKTASTAAAATAILVANARHNSAAICSEVCTSLYPDLTLLEKGVQNEDNNFTKFWIVTSSTAPTIAGAMCEDSHRALLRVSSPSRQPSDLSPLIAQLKLAVLCIDRRPSMKGLPFQDTYFLHVTWQDLQVCQEFPVEGTSSWVEEVDSALERVRSLGWKACAIGIW